MNGFTEFPAGEDEKLVFQLFVAKELQSQAEKVGSDFPLSVAN